VVAHELRDHLEVVYGAVVAAFIVVALTPAVAGMARRFGAVDQPDERRAHVDGAVERAIGLGATKVRLVEERGERHYVMQDIEGNEFCLD
jgi:hypothetical protein